MTQLDIVVPINEPTDWISFLVAVEKPDSYRRICLDPRHLNKAIKREHYCLPAAIGIFPEMAGAQYFTKLDASNAFWQIRVDENSKLLTFDSPCDRLDFYAFHMGFTEPARYVKPA